MRRGVAGRPCARRWWLAGPGAAALLALATGAFTPRDAGAQVVVGKRDRYDSPQHFAFELRFGPYRPDIDSEFDGQNRAPYRDFFGAGRRLMTQIEVDYQILRRFGSLGVGLGAGYFSANGNNPLADGSGTKTADESTLKIVPLSLSAVYRFDLGYEMYRIPLVPYGKLGLDYGLWWISNGNGEVAHDPSGGTGRGGTLGWHAAVGLSLVLDFFEPDTARQFDAEMGVNHSHVFVELGHWDLSGFGRAGQLRVGDTTWVAGLLFEF